MSRHSNRYSSYGGDYDGDYDDPRDHRDRYHLPDPEEHGNKYKASRGHQQDPRHQIVPSHPAHHHLNNFSRSYPFPDFELHEPNPRPQLPPPNLEGRMAEKFWHMPEQIAILGGENTRQSREPAEGSERFGRRAIEPAYHEQEHAKPRRHGIKAHPAPNANIVWKRPDEEKLLKYIKEGRDYPYIAEKLGRTARSCGVHWQKHVSHWPEARNVVYNPSMTVNGVNLRMYRNRPA